MRQLCTAQNHNNNGIPHARSLVTHYRAATGASNVATPAKRRNSFRIVSGRAVDLADGKPRLRASLVEPGGNVEARNGLLRGALLLQLQGIRADRRVVISGLVGTVRADRPARGRRQAQDEKESALLSHSRGEKLAGVNCSAKSTVLSTARSGWPR